MKDKDFLQWIHNRLHYVHGDEKNADFMYKLRAIIYNTPKEQVTPNSCSLDYKGVFEND